MKNYELYLKRAKVYHNEGAPIARLNDTDAQVSYIPTNSGASIFADADAVEVFLKEIGMPRPEDFEAVKWEGK